MELRFADLLRGLDVYLFGSYWYCGDHHKQGDIGAAESQTEDFSILHPNGW